MQAADPIRVAAAAIVTVGIAFLATGCGGSPNAAAITTEHSATSQPLAFSHCIRANGVPNFPDPNSSGVWPKSQVELAAGSVRFEAATHTCGHLLPDGGPGVSPSPTVVQLIGLDMTKFAHCMRAHGVADWPDPTLDRGREVFDPQAAGVDTNTPQISANVRECERVFPPSIGIPPGA
ncbi:MAG TPA: hypothetical protein VGL84_01230 [Gaiellaceae bacterium]